MLTIKLLDSGKEIEDKIKSAFIEEVNSRIQNNLTTLLEKSKNLAEQWVSSQPELISLSSKTIGSLKGQFGIPDGQDLLATLDIISAVRESISIKFVKYKAPLNLGGLQINFQPSNFTNLLGLDSGHVLYFGGDLHWLSWLLTEGNRIIIVGYYYDPETGIGRSGLGVMNEGGFFRVPTVFSGTTQNNFITRALIGRQQELAISNIFKSILE